MIPFLISNTSPTWGYMKRQVKAACMANDQCGRTPNVPVPLESSSMLLQILMEMTTPAIYCVTSQTTPNDCTCITVRIQLSNTMHVFFPTTYHKKQVVPVGPKNNNDGYSNGYSRKDNL
eukprot:CAMPEP_0119007556 /NCGR_PEP_ID=MMETSP1176-20130426/3087_1 /TAXON_ID=265551 /ORGANISM="Synedropsis recta cf, Strain CCMP1620" /LENGTH=118 /DNA_ID=CAMNT_0006959727 /DNA_START=140 /DNA_END=496 /DNA_ORIENTATION=+